MMRTTDLETHVPSGIHLHGEARRAREILDRAIATIPSPSLMVGVVSALTVKKSACYVGFSDRNPSTTAERAHAVCHIAAVARECGASLCSVAFDSHHDWLRGLGLREVDGECIRPESLGDGA